MSWVAGCWKVQLPSSPVPLWWKGAGRNVLCVISGGVIHLGMDTSKNTIVAGILMPGEEAPVLDRIWDEEGSVRHLIGRRRSRCAALRCCYEAGRAGPGCTGCCPRLGWPVMWSRRR
jgi:hypothetical protein